VKVTQLNDPEAVKPCANEYKILESLDHENIIKVYDFFVSQTKCQTVMERANGISLEKLVNLKPLRNEEITHVLK